MMKYFSTKQYTKLNSSLPNFNSQEIDGILYFTIVGVQGKQRWKTDGVDTVLVASVRQK